MKLYDVFESTPNGLTKSGQVWLPDDVRNEDICLARTIGDGRSIVVENMPFVTHTTYPGVYGSVIDVTQTIWNGCIRSYLFPTSSVDVFVDNTTFCNNHCVTACHKKKARYLQVTYPNGKREFFLDDDDEREDVLTWSLDGERWKAHVKVSTSRKMLTIVTYQYDVIRGRFMPNDTRIRIMHGDGYPYRRNGFRMSLKNENTYVNVLLLPNHNSERGVK